MIRYFASAVVIASLSLTLSACGEDEKASEQTPVKKVEQAQPVAPKKAAEASQSQQDMTPAEALDNMKRDAGIVADKAAQGYNSAKDAISKAISDE